MYVRMCMGVRMYTYVRVCFGVSQCGCVHMVGYMYVGVCMYVDVGVDVPLLLYSLSKCMP